MNLEIKNKIKDLSNLITKDRVRYDIVKLKIDKINHKIRTNRNNSDIETELDQYLKEMENLSGDILNNESRLKHEEYKLKFENN